MLIYAPLVASAVITSRQPDGSVSMGNSLDTAHRDDLKSTPVVAV